MVSDTQITEGSPISPIPADQAMATLASSFHLDGLSLWIIFAGLVTLTVASGISTNTTIANNIYNKIHCLTILINVHISTASALNCNSAKRQRKYSLNSCDTLLA